MTTWSTVRQPGLWLCVRCQRHHLFGGLFRHNAPRQDPRRQALLRLGINLLKRLEVPLVGKQADFAHTTVQYVVRIRAPPATRNRLGVTLNYPLSPLLPRVKTAGLLSDVLVPARPARRTVRHNCVIPGDAAPATHAVPVENCLFQVTCDVE